MFCFLCNDQKIGNEITSDAHLLPGTNANYIDGLAIFAYMNLTRCLFLSLSLPFSSLFLCIYFNLLLLFSYWFHYITVIHEVV